MGARGTPATAAVAKAGFKAEVVDKQTREREKAEKAKAYRSEIKRFSTRSLRG